MRVLITGVTGFVGHHLADLLRQQGTHQLHGTTRRTDAKNEELGLTLHLFDPLNVESVLELLKRIEPEWIFHLAGYAHAGRSSSEAPQAWDGNLGATRVLFEAIQKWDSKPRVLTTSSGLIYGDPESAEEIFDERTPLRPATPYAASKAAADLLAFQVWKQYAIPVIRARPFNQIGPGQSADYATANFARQIAAIEAGQQSTILETGNLSGQRDLTDVRDMVRAFVGLIERGQAGEAYNCATGRTYSMREIVDHMIGLSKVKIEVREKIDGSRAADTLVSRANISKLVRTTGWTPVYTLSQTLQDILEDWRGK